MKKIAFLLVLMLNIRAGSPVKPSPGLSPGLSPSPSPGLSASTDPSTVQHEAPDCESNPQSFLCSPSLSNVKALSNSAQLQKIAEDLNEMKNSLSREQEDRSRQIGIVNADLNKIKDLFSREKEDQNKQTKIVNDNLNEMRNVISREQEVKKAQNQRIEKINETLKTHHFLIKGLQENCKETKKSLREMPEDIKNEIIDFFNTEQDRVQKNFSIQLNRIKSEFLNKLGDQEQITSRLQTKIIDESKGFQNKLKDIEKKFKQISQQDQDIKNMKPKIEELVKENKELATQRIKQDKHINELFEANEIFAQQRMQDQKQIENLFQHVKKIQKDSCLLLVAYVVLGFCCLIFLCFK